MRTARSASSEDEIDRRLGDIARIGVVESVDLDAGMAVVSFGEQLTPPIDWLMDVGDTTTWVPPTQGQQVLVIAPEGDVEQAVIVKGVRSSQHAALFLGRKNAIRFADGTRISNNPDTRRLDIEAAGTINLVAPDGLNISGDVEILGKLAVSDDITTPKSITADVDVVAAGKSLKNHRHPAGTPLTGPPQ